jgi:hypothetical protein
MLAVLNSTSKNALSFLLCLCLLFNKLEIRAKQVLPGSEGGWRGERGGREQGRKMAQTMYAYVNK